MCMFALSLYCQSIMFSLLLQCVCIFSFSLFQRRCNNGDGHSQDFLTLARCRSLESLPVEMNSRHLSHLLMLLGLPRNLFRLQTTFPCLPRHFLRLSSPPLPSRRFAPLCFSFCSPFISYTDCCTTSSSFLPVFRVFILFLAGFLFVFFISHLFSFCVFTRLLPQFSSSIQTEYCFFSIAFLHFPFFSFFKVAPSTARSFDSSSFAFASSSSPSPLLLAPLQHHHPYHPSGPLHHLRGIFASHKISKPIRLLETALCLSKRHAKRKKRRSCKNSKEEWVCMIL